MHVWFSGTNSSGMSIEVSPNRSRSFHQTSSLPSRLFDYVVLNQHTCWLMKLEVSSHVRYIYRTSNNICYITPAIMYVTIATLGTVASDQQACLFKLHRPVCISVLLAPDRQSSPHCHSVSRHVCHNACWIMWHRTVTHVWNQAVFFFKCCQWLHAGGSDLWLYNGSNLKTYL